MPATEAMIFRSKGMSKVLTNKNYFRAALIIGFFAALIIYLPNQETIDGPYENYFGNPVSEASVEQEVYGNVDFELEQRNGVRILNPDTGRYTYYFEYIANKQDTLRRISALPFLIDSRPSSVACELMTSPFNPLDNSALTQEARDATTFFWDAKAEDFIFYECYKSPMKHTLLLSKTSDRVLHKIEFI